MEGVDTAEALEWLYRVLAALAALLGALLTLNQLTRSAILRRREEWLRSALSAEGNPNRQQLLRELLDRTTAYLVAGILFPRRYYFIAIAWLVAAPAQAVMWTHNDREGWSLLWSALLAMLCISMPIRQVIRVLSERERFLHDYLQAAGEIRKPRTDILAAMEGGTRKEFLLAYLAGASVAVAAVGLSLFLSGSSSLGFWMVVIGIGGAIVLVAMIRGYVRSRATISGPYPPDHEGL
ncbi:hypothetical protein HGQ17_01210 [Nesterenkonia sp. MY13]|uniref:Uncharacterized protein n=1 Tax=Nesterenkonia sedimenti TaxID=1463632 RepID=A0A7X8THF5_9MICC|nr:hypothetical protein [Nesterenkonia sedimenti]NLS08644.1 hypothetical protein [Nesterenkonia sedimenti]